MPPRLAPVGAGWRPLAPQCPSGPRGAFLLGVLRMSSPQHIGHAVVPFVAGVFEDEVDTTLHRDGRRKRGREGRWVVDGVLVGQRIGVQSRESFDQPLRVLEPGH
jgi:hypothetical protein